MFANMDESSETYKADEQYVETGFVTTEHHLTMMTKNFKRYFLADLNLVTTI